MTCVDRMTRCIVSYDVACDREPVRLQALVDRAPQVARYYSDQYAAYANVVYYPGQHAALPHKSQTYSVEADNAELRHYLARLGRRSRCFTRSLRALRDAIKLVVYACNRRQLARRAHPKYPGAVRDFVYPQLLPLPAIGALGALVAFCVVPYGNAGGLGSLTGPQVATVLAAVPPSTASGSATSGQSFSPTTLASVLWAEAALAVIAGAVALWQIAHRANSGRPISTLVTLVVLSASCASLLILGFQYVGLQSSTATKVAAAYLGSGFWGTVAEMVVVAVGAMVHISA